MSSSDTHDIGTISEPGMEAGSMKIKDAKEIYIKHGLSLQPDFEALAVVFRKCDIEAPIANSNYLHALSLTDLMFRHADHSLEMVTGGCGDGFIGGLKKSFLAMLEKIRKVEGKARIIVIDGETENLKTWANDEYKDVLELVEATANEGVIIPHFIVCDKDMVRDEEKHGPLDDDTDANKVRADVFFNNHSKARVFTTRFNAMWEALRGNSRE